eukprot:746273-Hanusia_phi.AAC.1
MYAYFPGDSGQRERERRHFKLEGIAGIAQQHLHPAQLPSLVASSCLCEVHGPVLLVPDRLPGRQPR